VGREAFSLLTHEVPITGVTIFQSLAGDTFRHILQNHILTGGSKEKKQEPCQSPQGEGYFEGRDGCARRITRQHPIVPMMIFDEHDLDCWIILAILSLIMASPLR
jgi:hypothetical protein